MRTFLNTKHFFTLDDALTISMKFSPSTVLLKGLLPLLLIGLWWALTRWGSIPPILLPSLEAVAKTFWTLLRSGKLIHDIEASAFRALVGFSLSAVMAISLAFLLTRYRALQRFLSIPLEALRVIPPLALIPLLILWLGINEAPKIAIVILASFFPIFLSTRTALANVDPKLIEVGHVLGFSTREIQQRIVLPSALPALLTGLRLGFGYSWRALVGAELIAASSGLGYLINDSADFGQTSVVFVGIITIAVLGILADALLAGVIKRLTTHWSQARSVNGGLF